MADSQQRYRVVQKLEAGGMAEVFRAESEGLQGFKKQVAIKRVLPHLAEKKKFISMFLDEARLSAQLNHSNCVQVFDIGVGDNTYFIVMEFVEGANLKAIMESLKKHGKEFPISTAVFIALEICKGLSYAHELRDTNGVEMKIVHRDMSPPNVLITKFGEVKIVDFGLAKASSQLEKSEPGIIKGKFSYLSPEAAQGQDVDARTDIFAVGIILWELLTGQRLFLGETDFQTVKKVQEGRVPPMTAFNPRVTKELEDIVQKALARDPAERYLTARDLGKDLARHLYKIGVPVSSFDVESLVQGTMREIKKTRAPQVSIIDKLIEEALLEFTSLKDDDKPASSSGEVRSSSPLNIGEFEDPSKWLNEMGMEPVKSYKADPRISLHDATRNDGSLGTLSQLEDESARRIRLATPSPSSSSIAIGTPALRPEPRLTAPKPIEPKKPTALIAVLVGVLFLLMIAVAWALKIIPH